MKESRGQTKPPASSSLGVRHAPGRASRDLRERAHDPGFTPSVRDVDALVDLLAEDDHEKAAELAMVRVGGAALPTVRARFEIARPPLRARLVRVIARLSKGEPDGGFPTLRAALEDGDPKTRRNAAIALGHVRAAEVEQALFLAWTKDPRPEMRRSIAASLGKVGSVGSVDLLRKAASADDAELCRIAHRALLMIERTASREGRGQIDGTRSPVRPVPIVAFARRGLEELLAGELARIAAVSDPRVIAPGQVQAHLVGPLDGVFAARTMVGFQFPLPSEKVGEGEPPADAIARAATGGAARAIFDAFTRGVIRYRIAWEEGGHKRAATWDAATAIGRLAPEFVNDPTASLWGLAITIRPGWIDVAIAPRGLDDPRFAWRRRDVPAASHPTFAAALARVAGARADDVVWDPFVGSGAELVERALLGPYRALLGSDIEPRALSAARENFAAARVDARLETEDALSFVPEGVTLILTNPPMGRRAARATGLADLLDRFVAHASRVLRPGGRLVWIAPWPSRARETGLRAGLTLEWARTIDMGGFDAEMQRWTKSA